MKICFNTQESNKDKHPMLPNTAPFVVYEFEDENHLSIAELVDSGYQVMSKSQYDLYLNSIDMIKYNALILNDNKNRKNVKIDEKTQQLISQGFMFNGEYFSLSQSAQINWLGLKILQDTIIWPLQITTKNGDIYSLVEANLMHFLSISNATIQMHLNSGRTLKTTINKTITQTELDAIKDER